jgi:mRNA-degrading endonuclease RelE of RelBE toxin-antitoxin system
MFTMQYLEAVKEDLRALPQGVKEKLRKAIEKKLMLNPVEFGKPLQYSLKGLRRLRGEDYRIVYQTDNPNLFILYFKDDATAFNAQKKGTIQEKGVMKSKAKVKIL